MNDPHQIDRLAIEIMKWDPMGGFQSDTGVWLVPNLYGVGGYRIWKPWEDWNDFRRLEKKVMEDEELFDLYCDEMMAKKELGHCCMRLITNDLHTRVDALLAALDSLTQS